MVKKGYEEHSGGKKQSFIYQNTSSWSKRGSILKETFESQIS